MLAYSTRGMARVKHACCLMATDPIFMFLLKKSRLFSYGIGGKTMKWIDAFLCFRQQRVVVNGVKSDWAPLCQASHRAPFLVPCCFPCTSMTSCQTLSLK